MRYGPYKKIDNAIKARDSGGVWERWRYGRRLLCDPEKTTPKGYLQHGRLDWLVRWSGESEREIQWRLQCARTYPQESQIRSAATDFGTWWALVRAGFPPYPATEGERPYNPLETDELLRQQQEQSERWAEDALYGNGGLIPREFTDDSPLHELDRHADARRTLADDSAEWERAAREFDDALKKAVNGNVYATLGEAKRALHGDGD